MSTFKAPLCRFELENHPNADTLSIVKIGGWQCVVKTIDFEKETFAVYLPLDSIAANDHPLLGFLAGKRIETCKLRGVISQGLLLPYSEVLKYMVEVLGMSTKSVEKVSIEGRDFSGILRIKKWEDVSSKFKNGILEIQDPHFQKYTDIENIKNFKDVILIGELVDISEKIHGTSSRYSFIDQKFMIGSRNCQLKQTTDNTVWHFIYKKYKIDEKLLYLHNKFNKNDVSIYGEIAGPGIQDLNYGQTEPVLFVYDIMIGDSYLPPVEYRKLCNELQLLTCPLLKSGPFDILDLDLRFGNSTLSDHIREGIVIKPLEPRWNYELGRVILKVISEDYLLRRGAKDVSYL